MKWSSEVKSLSHAWLFATPWTVAYQAPSMGFSRQEYWSGLPFPSPRESSRPRDRTWVSRIAGRHITIWATIHTYIKEMLPLTMEMWKKTRSIWNDPVCKTGKETQMCIMDFWTQREGEGGMIWENDILTCMLSCKNWIASLCLMQDTACLELVHGDDPERCYGEGGGRGVHVWERM